MEFVGTPTDQSEPVLATGRGDVRCAFVSLSARDPAGRDADYLKWHQLDHMPEQYRLPGIRHAQRVVSTPACRAARAASGPEFDAADHVVTYLFASDRSLGPFVELAKALRGADRWPIHIPRVASLSSEVAGRAAAPRVVAGADVVPWRPLRGIYLMIEDGHAPAADLVEVEGVAGVWWAHGTRAPDFFGSDSSGRQLTWCYLDGDPVDTAHRLAGRVRARWASGEVRGLLAAPFMPLTPFAWDRYLP